LRYELHACGPKALVAKLRQYEILFGKMTRYASCERFSSRSMVAAAERTVGYPLNDALQRSHDESRKAKDCMFALGDIPNLGVSVSR
jgi:hypothetical protein